MSNMVDKKKLLEEIKRISDKLNNELPSGRDPMVSFTILGPLFMIRAMVECGEFDISQEELDKATSELLKGE